MTKLRVTENKQVNKQEELQNAIRIPMCETRYSALKVLRFLNSRQLCFYAEDGGLAFSRGTSILVVWERLVKRSPIVQARGLVGMAAVLGELRQIVACLSDLVPSDINRGH